MTELSSGHSTERRFHVGDVWLCSSDRYLPRLRQREILEVAGHCVRVSKNWLESEWMQGGEWNNIAKTKLGTARRFLGIRWGIKR